MIPSQYMNQPFENETVDADGKEILDLDKETDDYSPNMNKNASGKNHERSTFKENLLFIFVLLLILIPLRFFILQPFRVVGSSMEPTFFSDDYLIVEELSYKFENPDRGDVVIFKFEGGENAPTPDTGTETFFIKRIIALPGETIVIKDGKVTIKNTTHPEGITLDESYVKFPRDTNETRTLKEDELYVMGDNRDKSYDSRAWGPLKKQDLVGKALVRLYPFNSIDFLPGHADEPK